MYSVEEVYESASNLYWIAFLLTARAELSLNLIMEVLDTENGLELIAAPQTLPNVRRRVVTKALSAIREEITASAQRTALQQPNSPLMPIASWSTEQHISQTQFEEAVIAIDVFSRCSLLLTTFEGLHVNDVAHLLHCDRELIACGREQALWQLTCSLTSGAPGISLRFGRTGEPASMR